MPNLVHSLDAASLALLLDSYFNDGLQNIFTVHDCFAVTANNVPNLIKIIKLVYIKIYSDNLYLETFDNAIIESIRYQFGIDAFDNENKIIKVNGDQYQYPDINKVIVGQIQACKIKNANFIIN